MFEQHQQTSCDPVQRLTELRRSLPRLKHHTIGNSEERRAARQGPVVAWMPVLSASALTTKREHEPVCLLRHVFKPVELVRWLVEIGSQPGDAVLDPFGGDATTAMACQELGRHCTVIERDPAVAAAIRQRVAAVTRENVGLITTVEEPRR